MGTARSGTSFVGDVLGRATETVYLREPITEPMFRRFRQAPLVNRLHEDPPPAPLRDLADAAFSGRVPWTPKVVTHPTDALSPTARTLVVKEVQPLASPWLARRYRPRFVALFRHPAAIAASWWGRGWTRPVHEVILRRRFRRDGVGPDPAERLGAVIAVHEQAMLEVLNDQHDAIPLFYEDVASDPTTTLRELYGRLALSWSAEIAQAVHDITSGRPSRRTPSRLVRHAPRRIDVWRTTLDRPTIEAIRLGYARSGGTLYLNAW